MTQYFVTCVQDWDNVYITTLQFSQDVVSTKSSQRALLQLLTQWRGHSNAEENVREHAALREPAEQRELRFNKCKLQYRARHAACAPFQQAPEQRVARLQQIRTKKRT